MLARWPLVLMALAASQSGHATAQSVSSPPPIASATRAPRTISYHARDLVALRAKVRYTTMIVLPEGEDILEVTCGDKEFWVIEGKDGIVYVKPAKEGVQTNVNVVSKSKVVYSFMVQEITKPGAKDKDKPEGEKPEGAEIKGNDFKGNDEGGKE